MEYKLVRDRILYWLTPEENRELVTEIFDAKNDDNAMEQMEKNISMFLRHLSVTDQYNYAWRLTRYYGSVDRVIEIRWATARREHVNEVGQRLFKLGPPPDGLVVL